VVLVEEDADAWYAWPVVLAPFDEGLQNKQNACERCRDPRCLARHLANIDRERKHGDSQRADAARSTMRCEEWAYLMRGLGIGVKQMFVHLFYFLDTSLKL
jgi:hypothetical protein